MGREITLFTGLWAFVALPNLCTAGVLAHPCDCETPTGCSHDVVCADDPCNAVTRPNEDSPNDQLVSLLLDDSLSAIAIDISPAPRTILTRSFQLTQLVRWAPPWRFLSDVPLLI